MSGSIFMRGDPLNLTSTFYLAFTSGSATYVYSLNSSNYSTNSVTPVAGFLEMTSDYADYSVVQFTITSLGNNSYTLQSGTNYLGLNSSNIIDLVSDISVAITFKGPSGYTANVYNIANTLYPGIPYQSLINGSSYKWYTFQPTSTSSWNYYTIVSNTVTPFFFPVNTGQLSTWQTNSTYPAGACFYSSTDSNIGIEWLYNWTTGTSVNCDTEGTLDSSYNNCYFSSLLACEAMYVYNLCTGTETCGTCLGSTGTTGTGCYFNTPGSDPALFQATASLTLSVNNAIELPDTSSNSNGSSGNCSTGGIILIIFLILLFVIIIGVVVYKSKSKSDTSSSTTKHNTKQTTHN